MADLAFTSALEQADLVRTREVSPVELVETYLERIESLDGPLHTFETVTAENALGDARAKEAVLAGGSAPDPLPPFYGVPITIKDLNALAGVPARFGSRAFADFVAPWTDVVVERILEAGFVSLGKSTTPELGSTPVTETLLSGPTRNPWNPDHTPGGSSGGAAAGVAAGLAPIAQGSDGGGSVRIPSSCCGLFGIKASRGRVSSAPMAGYLSMFLATNGPIARTVADGAALLDVMAQGPATGDPIGMPPPAEPFLAAAGREPGRLRVRWSLQSGSGPVHPECRAAVEATVDVLGGAGHDVAEVVLPDPAELREAFVTVWLCMVAATPVPEGAELEPVNQWMVEQARPVSAADFAKALYRVNMFSRAILGAFEAFDVLVTPTLCAPPLSVGAGGDLPPAGRFALYSDWAGFTPLYNATGQPAVSVPAHWSAGGLPVGVQLVGRTGAEATLVSLAAQLEALVPWADRRPPGV